MKSKYVNGTINKDIYIHPDAETRQEIEEIKAVNERQDEEINTLEERKQDKLTAGENITISEDNVISATGGIDPEQLVTVITAEATNEQVPSAKAVWNQAVKYAKAKRFIGTSTRGGNLYLASNNIADIYNAIHFGNQTVFIYDTFTEMEYRVTYCFIDNTDPSAQRIVVYAESAHVDTDNSASLGITENYVDHLYVKASANASYLIPYTSIPQDKLVAGKNITISGNVISSTGGSVDNTIVMPESVYNQITSGQTEITPSDECWGDAQEFFGEIENAISTDNRAQIQTYYWEHNDEDNTNTLTNTVYQVVAGYSSPEDEGSENLVIQIRGVAFNGSIANGTSLELVDNQLIFSGSDVSLVNGFITSNSLNFESGLISGSGSGGSGTGEVNVAIFDLSATVNESHQPTVINIGLSEQSIGGDTSEIEQQISDIVDDIDGIKSSITSINNTLNNKQDKLTFDDYPTEGSINPVTSGGVYTALDNVYNNAVDAAVVQSVEQITPQIVQSDWSISDGTSKAYIASKPGMYSYVGDAYVEATPSYSGIYPGRTSGWYYREYTVAYLITSQKQVELKYKLNGTTHTSTLTLSSSAQSIFVSGAYAYYTTTTISSRSYRLEFIYTPKVDNKYLVLFGAQTSSLIDPSIISVLCQNVPVDVQVPNKYITNTEKNSNKVTSLSASSTDIQYPSAKCVYDMIGDVETLLSNI